MTAVTTGTDREDQTSMPRSRAGPLPAVPPAPTRRGRRRRPSWPSLGCPGRAVRADRRRRARADRGWRVHPGVDQDRSSSGGCSVELTDHLGYEKGSPDAAAFANSRNGSTPKTVATQVGDVELDVPRDREGSFAPRLVPKGSRRLGGLDDMIISLYAGGMTVRDIAHHLRVHAGHRAVPRDDQQDHRRRSPRRSWPGRPGRWTRSTGDLPRRDRGQGPRRRTRDATRPPTSRSGSTWTASSTCSGSGSRPTRARSSGPGSAPSSPTAGSATC